MRRIILAAAVLFAGALSAFAQSGCQYIAQGAVLTPAQWNFCFSQKQNVIGFTPVNKAGDTMLGRLTMVAPTTLAASMNLPHGTAPTSPNNGDVWTTTSGIFVRINGATVGPLASTTTPAASIVVGTTTVTSGTSNGILFNNAGVLGNTASVASAVLVTSGGGVPSFSTTLPAFTLGGAIAGNGQDISNAGVIGGTSFSVAGTAGAGYVAYAAQSVTPSTPAANNFRLFADATGRLSWVRSDGFVRTFTSGTLTANRVYTLPDATAALLYDGGPLGSPSTAGTMPAFVLGGAVTASGSRPYGIDLSGATLSTGSILAPNNAPLQQKDSGGTARSLIYITNADAMLIGNGAQNIFISPLTGFVPLTDNASAFGGAGNRWASVHTMADKMYGSSSGVITVQAPAAAGTNTITWPAATGIVALTAGGTVPTIATGDILYASAANVLSALADVATGNALISGGVGVAPSWGKIGISTHVSGLGTGVATALGTNVGSAGAPVVNGGALGTPSSATLTSATGLPISTGVSGLGTGIATALAVNTGSAGAPVLFNGAGGTPTSVTLTNGSGLPTTGLTGTLQAAQEPAHTGDVTNTAGSLALTIANNAVTLAKLATQATNTVLGNATSGSAVPTALSVGSCSTAGSALNWTTNTGFGCNTSITAAAVPVSGITGAGANVLTFLATPSSANLAAALTDEVGTVGVVPFASTGTPTPALSFGGASVGITYATQTSNTYRIGNLVYETITLILSSKGSSAGTALISTGFTPTANAACSVQVNNLAATAITQIQATVLSGTASINMQRYATGVVTAMADTDFANNSVVRVTCAYTV